MPSRLAAYTLAEKANQTHPHVASVIDVEPLGEPYPIILVNDRQFAFLVGAAGQGDLGRQA